MDRGEKMKIKNIWYHIARLLCYVFCKVAFKYRAHDTENVPLKGPVLLVSNHQSYLDPIFCGVRLKRKVSFLARDSLFRNPLFGALICSVGAFPVRRGEADIKAMKQVINKLKENAAVCLFPEATRTHDGKIADFRPGFGLMCRKAKANLVPVVIDGAYECWPRHKKLFKFRSPINIVYGEPLTPDEIEKFCDRDLAKHINDQVRNMLNDIRIKNNKQPYEY